MIGIEILIIMVLILVNGMLAMSEIALVSVRKARLHQLADDGDKKAKVALDLANHPDDFLSTVQVGITLVGILAGAFGGATIAEELAEYVKVIPELAPYADAVSLAVVVALITYLSLIVGELVPKRIALIAPEKIARNVAVPMLVVAKMARPLVSLLSGSTNAVLRLMGITESNEPPITEAEIHVLVDQATQSGVFEEVEQEMVAGVLGLGNRKVTSIMTPRPDVVWIDTSSGNEEMKQLLEESPHSRFIVAEGSLDNVVGIVEAKAVMRRMHEQTLDLRSLVVQPPYVPKSMTALELLERLRDTKHHMAIVMDEFGGLAGIVARDDIFQAIVGELPLLGEEPKWSFHQRDDGSWLIDGQVPTSSFKDLLSLDKLPGEAEASYHTLAGFILDYTDCIPEEGYTFQWDNFKFEIVDMDYHRIDKVLVSKLPAESVTEEATQN